jgi:NAD(P)-dependent dehydrogenase (short-subunit alcohol dehydrogenase family)
MIRETTAALGPVDILVNAAGIDFNHAICGHPDEIWHRIIDTNLTGTYRMIKRCLPGMMDRRWGRIINIASTSSIVGHALKPAYSASKSGLLGLTRCVALEGAAHGVSCNAISPATVETEMLNTTFLHTSERTGSTVEELRRERLETYPQKRFLEPREIGALAAFLCRDDAFGITMENIAVSAGALF